MIEGQKAKILISPLKNFGNDTINRIIEAQNLQGNSNEFYIAITTQPKVNLGGILLKIRYALTEIKKALILSGESFRAPLRHFSEDEIRNLIDSSDIKEDLGQNESVSYFSTIISSSFNHQIKSILNQFSKHILDLKNAFVTLEGGFLLSNVEKIPDSVHSLDSIATMCQSLMSTADKCSWLLKKMHAETILIECIDSFQFINKVGKNNLFSTEIRKGRQKLGLLRLILPRYSGKISELLKEIQYLEPTSEAPKLENLFTELILTGS